MPEGRGTSGAQRGTRITRAVGNAYANNGVLQTIGRNSENCICKQSLRPVKDARGAHLLDEMRVTPTGYWLKRSESNAPTSPPLPFDSMTSRATCGPALNFMLGIEIVVHSLTPVSGTLIEPI